MPPKKQLKLQTAVKQTLAGAQKVAPPGKYEIIADPKIETFNARRVNVEYEQNRMIWFNKLDLSEELMVVMKPETDLMLDPSELYMKVVFRILTIDEQTQERVKLPAEVYITERKTEVKELDERIQDGVGVDDKDETSLAGDLPVYKTGNIRIMREVELLDGMG